MSTEVAEHKVDRTGWTPGPWDGEPDKVQWNHAGFACLAVRNRMGAWCGYVGVPREHPAYKQDYNEVEVDVHGGLTFADKCQPKGPICHVPEPGFPEDVWWLGFDTAHHMDIVPSMLKYGNEFGTYRTLRYIKRETNSLARQLAAYGMKQTVKAKED